MIKKAFGSLLEKAVQRADGWANALTGIGQAMRDKRMGTRHYVNILDREQLESIWRGDDMAARIVETIPNEMLREGFDIKIQDDQAAAELLMRKVEDLCVSDKYQEALEYERAYGGSAILIGANDGSSDLREPLNEGGIKSLDWLTVMAAYELHPVAYYADPQAPKFGEPMIYQLHPDMPAVSNIGKSYVQVHESRLIRFTGIKVSRRQLRQNNGWGDSVLVRVHQVLSDFHQSWGAAGILLQDFSMAVLKIKDLAELIATNQDDVVAARAKALAMSGSVARMFLIDSEESYERKATPMTGLPEMLDKFSLRLSAAADMPVSLLIGQGVGGLNAGAAAQSDVRFFYDRTAAKQTRHLKPKLSQLLRLLMLTRGSATRGVEPENWSITFNPLWQATALETAQERKLVAEADAIYVQSQVCSPAEIAESRFGGDAYSTETTVDLEGRKALVLAKPAEGDGVPPKPLRPTQPVPAAGPEYTRGINGGPT